MSKVLAPSNVGYVSRSTNIGPNFWGASPTAEPTINAGDNAPTTLYSFKSNLVRSDGRRPTDYTRMIGKIIPRGSADCNDGKRRFKSPGASGIGLYGLPNGCVPSTGKVSVPAWLEQRVIQDALIEMNQLSNNILEDLGQLKQTASMFVNIVQLIIDLYVSARLGNWRALRRAFRHVGVNIPRYVANGWLMYFYGIKPLIGTLDAIAYNATDIDRRIKVRKRSQTSTSPGAYLTGSWALQCTGEAFMQAQCQLEAHINMSQSLRYWANLGLSQNFLSDAVVTAWALVPYSFVVDWVIPVESWLRSMSWSPTLVYQGGFVGRRHVVNSEVTNFYPFYGGPYAGELPRASLQIRFYKRISYPYVIPTSHLAIRLSLSPTQLTSAVALLTK